MNIATLALVFGMVSIFVAVFVSLTAIGAFSNEARGVSKSLAVVEAFSAAPKAMQDELDPSFKERVLLPGLERLAGVGRRFTPADYGDRVRERLERAGNPTGWTIERVTAMKVVALGALAVGSLLFVMILGMGPGPGIAIVSIGMAVGYFAPDLYLYQKGADRANAMRKTFPDALDLLTISVEAGLGFDAALAHVARNVDGPLSDEFARVLQEMQIGMGRAGALKALGERTTLEEMRSFVTAMVQADSFGVPIGRVLRVQSSEIRVKRRQRAEEMAQKLPVKILFPLIFFILPCLFVVVMGPAGIAMYETLTGL